MKVIYIGEDYFSYQEKDMLNACRGVLSAAHHLFQQNIIESLNNKVDLSVITTLPIGSFPGFSKKLWVDSHEYADHYECGYVNFPILKEFSKRNNLKKRIIREADYSDDLIYILVYDSYSPLLGAALDARKAKKNIRVVNIIPDLPGEKCIDYNMYGKLAGLLQKRRGKQFYKNIKKVDGAIVLTKHMIDELEINHIPCIVMECVVNVENDVPCIKENEKDDKIIIYAGEVSKVVNIDILLESFYLIEDRNARLWIFGSGDFEELVKKYEKKDERIKYFGFVTPTKLDEYKKRAFAYINPRQNKGEYTKYSFPSKNAEYLKTGKPLIAYGLDGIPKEYEEYMFIPADNSVESLSNVIKDVLTIKSEEIIQLAERQVKFMKSKSAEMQSNRIIELLGEIK